MCVWGGVSHLSPVRKNLSCFGFPACEWHAPHPHGGISNNNGILSRGAKERGGGGRGLEDKGHRKGCGLIGKRRNGRGAD